MVGQREDEAFRKIKRENERIFKRKRKRGEWVTGECYWFLLRMPTGGANLANY